VDEAYAEALLEQMADAIVASVEALRIHPVEAMHPFGERLERALDDEVKMVVEHAVGVQSPEEAVLGIDDACDDCVAVDVVSHDLLARDAAHRHVEDPVRREDGVTRGSGHVPTVAAPAARNGPRDRSGTNPEHCRDTSHASAPNRHGDTGQVQGTVPGTGPEAP
jgi:hypothetical protein